jgi:hypothetical protein
VPKIRIRGYLRVFFLPNFSVTDEGILTMKIVECLKNKELKNEKLLAIRNSRGFDLT